GSDGASFRFNELELPDGRKFPICALGAESFAYWGPGVDRVRADSHSRAPASELHPNEYIYITTGRIRIRVAPYYDYPKFPKLPARGGTDGRPPRCGWRRGPARLARAISRQYEVHTSAPAGAVSGWRRRCSPGSRYQGTPGKRWCARW